MQTGGLPDAIGPILHTGMDHGDLFRTDVRHLPGLLHRRAALLVLIGGTLAIAASLVFPALVSPFAHGIALDEGSKGFSYIRALYGLVV